MILLLTGPQYFSEDMFTRIVLTKVWIDLDISVLYRYRLKWSAHFHVNR